MSKEIVKLIRNIHSCVDQSGSIENQMIPDLGILFVALEIDIKKRLDEAKNFDSAHAVLKYYAFLGSEYLGTIAFEKSLDYATGDKKKVYLLACSFWILFSNSGRRPEMRNHFESIITRAFGEKYTSLLINKLAEQKMAFY